MRYSAATTCRTSSSSSEGSSSSAKAGSASSPSPFVAGSVLLDQAQRFGQPAAIGEQTFGLLRHVAFFRWSMSWAARSPAPSAHRGEDARLGYAAEIVARPSAETRRHHVEAGGARQPIRLAMRRSRPCWLTPDAAIGIEPLEQRVDAEADAMGEQIARRVASSSGEPIPQRLVVHGADPPVQSSRRRLGIGCPRQDPAGSRKKMMTDAWPRGSRSVRCAGRCR